VVSVSEWCSRREMSARDERDEDLDESEGGLGGEEEKLWRDLGREQGGDRN
jgi:hypothetical protein